MEAKGRVLTSVKAVSSLADRHIGDDKIGRKDEVDFKENKGEHRKPIRRVKYFEQLNSGSFAKATNCLKSGETLRRLSHTLPMTAH